LGRGRFLGQPILGIVNEAREDHAADIATWLKALKDDKKFIFAAASHAQQAVDFLHGLQPQPVRHDLEKVIQTVGEKLSLE
jgi:antirestriction protein ArdC